MRHLEIVASTDAGAFASLLTPLGGQFAQLTVYHHNATAHDVRHYVGPPETREASAFLLHAATRYNTLADLTAFVHEDVWMHNPVWPHWIACLRENTSIASLSPIWQRDAPGTIGPLAHLIHPAQSLGNRAPPWSCCFLMVHARQVLHTIPQATYELLTRRVVAPGGKSKNNSFFTPFHLENAGNVLYPLPANWLDPCVNYRCEEPRCKRMVRYVSHVGPASHGIPISTESRALASWQSRACGVVQLHEPEGLRLASVTERVPLPCGDRDALAPANVGGMMRTLDEVVNRTGCRVEWAKERRRTAWMNDATINYARTFQQLHLDATVPSAKIAVFAVKKAMCTGLVRCWQACCAECARRAGWCVAWEWTLSDEVCSLSTEAPIPASPSFHRVVGRM